MSGYGDILPKLHSFSDFACSALSTSSYKETAQ